MNTHTPGPWEIYGHSERRVIEPNEGVEILANAGVIAILYKKNWPNGADEANAHLIAAAPTMYEYIKSSASAGCATAKQILEQIHGNA